VPLKAMRRVPASWAPFEAMIWEMLPPLSACTLSTASAPKLIAPVALSMPVGWAALPGARVPSTCKVPTLPMPLSVVPAAASVAPMLPSTSSVPAERVVGPV